MKKLLSKDLTLYRKIQWEKQGKICPLCQEEIKEEDLVLDHCHSSGHCRMALHRSCNTSEGKCKNVHRRYVSGKGITLLDFLKNLIKYLEKDYSQNPIHPKELTDLEKELKKVNKKLKILKRESIVLQYKERAKELRKLIKIERDNNKWVK